MPRYWVGVVSKNHVLRGVEGSFARSVMERAALKSYEKGDYLYTIAQNTI